jgi:hypothetical protein
MPNKTNITLKLDVDLLRQVKVLAALEGTSISALLTRQLERAVNQQAEYEQARKSAKALMREAEDLGWKKPRSRDELHER